MTTNYTYAGPRNDERTAAGGTGFLNGTLGITRQTTGGANTSFIRDPDGTLISMRTSAGESFYYTTDALGSVIALTDSTQAKVATYTYDSWGTGTSTGTAAGTNPWRYAGGYKDNSSNLVKFGARYYSPGTGRFTQPDPSGQETNRYTYAQCSPTNRVDANGLYSFGSGDYWSCLRREVVSGIQQGLFFGAIGGAWAGAPVAAVGAFPGAVIGATGGALGGSLKGAVWGGLSCLWS